MKVQVNSINLFYEEYGQGVPIILLHGFPLNHLIWNDVVPYLIGQARVITPDLRGHGQSDAPEGVYTMAMLAEDITGLMDALGLARAIVVGHSMGGYAALALALKAPSRVAGIGLVATQAAADTPERKAGRYASVEDVRQWGLRNLAESMSANLTSRGDLQPLVRQMILSTRPEGVIGSLKGMAERPDVTGQLGRIHGPAVVVAGDADKLVPLEKSQTMARGLPDSRLVVISSAGHLPMMEAPREVADALGGLINPAGA